MVDKTDKGVKKEKKNKKRKNWTRGEGVHLG